MADFHTVISDRINYVYHWQRFDLERFTTFLKDRAIYCSDPSSFNDPWDCKPYFNTEMLEDPQECERHIRWAVEISREQNHTMSPDDIARMETQLRADHSLLAGTVEELSRDMWSAVAARYRVYCLGPDMSNLLMWSHYADSHQGICLEFGTRNEVMCCALRVEYARSFPVARAYSADENENLKPLLMKAEVWNYEREYRLVAQESDGATDHDTLVTRNNLLRLPEDALKSVIVGCQGPYDIVQRLVQEIAPDVVVKRAERIPNRFELRIA